MSNKMLESLAQQINAVELDSVFTLTVFDAGVARLSFPDGVYAPNVLHSETDDVSIDDPSWEALKGFTGQYGYNGAVNHPSEFVGREIARELARLAEDEPQTFVMVSVEVEASDEEVHEVAAREGFDTATDDGWAQARDMADGEQDAAGWAILRKIGENETCGHGTWFSTCREPHGVISGSRKG